MELFTNYIKKHYKVTNLDIKLIKTAVICTIFLLALFLIVDYKMTLKTLSVIGGIAYFFFLMLHIGMCYPLFVIFFGIDSAIKSLGIKNKSYIIHRFLVAIIGFLLCIFIYFLFPLLMAFMWNCSFDLIEAKTLIGGLMSGYD